MHSPYMDVMHARIPGKRLLLKVALALLFLPLLCSAGGYLWLDLHREEVQSSILEGLSAALGQSCSVNEAGIRFAPFPVLYLRGLESKGENLELSVAKALVVPSFSGLLRGRLEPSTIQLESPILFLPPTFLSRFFVSQNVSAPPELPAGCTLIIENGSCSLDDASHPFALTGLDCYLHIKTHNRIQGDLFIKSVHFAMANIPYTLEDILFLGDIAPFAREQGSSRFDLRAEFRGPSWLHTLTFQTSVGKKADHWSFRTSIKGSLNKDQMLIPYVCDGTITVSDDFQTVSFSPLHLGLGRDAATLEGHFRPGDKELSGHLSVERVSLTEWLGFARILPPGLMRSLDEVTDGSIDFVLDAKGLRVPNVSASCAGAHFVGKGGVADWRKPIVYLEMRAPMVDLITAIPEAGAILPTEPLYGHGPFTPDGHEKPDTTPGNEGISVGYDIRLSADNVIYGPLRINDAGVVIHPAKKASDDDIMLDATARFYDGTIKGSCVLSGIEELHYAIKLALSDVNGAGVGRAMPVIPVRKGRWNASLAVQSQGTTLDVFLKHLRGTVRAEGRQGELAMPGGKGLAFTTCQVKLDPLRFGQWRGKTLGLDGIWNADLDLGRAKTALAANGRIWFGKTNDSSGIELQNLDTNGTVTLRQEGKNSAATLLEARGRLHWPIQSGLRLSEATLHMPHADFSGLLQWSAQSGVGAKGTWNVASLSDLLRGLTGNSFSFPSFISSCSGKASLQFSGSSLTLSDLSLKTGLGLIQGSLGIEIGKKLFLSPKLLLPRLDGDTVFLRSDGQSGGNKKKPLDWSGIDKLKIKGQVEIGEFVVKKFPFRHVTIPIDLDSSLLQLTPIVGELYGGRLNGSADIIFSKSIEVQSSGSLSDCQLEQFSRDALTKGRLSGVTNLQGSFRAAFSSFGEWPSCLWGNWKFLVQNGGYQALEGIKPKGKPTLFKSLQGSGSIEHGIVRSNNVVLRGDGLELTGGGELNLEKMAFDGKFNVEKKGVPSFPLYVEGTFDKTKTAIGIGALLLNAVGGIFSGLLGIFH